MIKLFEKRAPNIPAPEDKKAHVLVRRDADVLEDIPEEKTKELKKTWCAIL